jgi:hypothetical protein
MWRDWPQTALGNERSRQQSRHFGGIPRSDRLNNGNPAKNPDKVPAEARLPAATDPSRVLYMAVSPSTYRGVLADQFGQLVVSGLSLNLVVFDEQQARIVQWIG